LLYTNIKIGICRTVILPAIYVVTKLGGFAESIREYGAGPQVKGGWRKLEKEDRNDLYCSILYHSFDEVKDNEVG
jgi:hypothetical protein